MGNAVDNGDSVNSHVPLFNEQMAECYVTDIAQKLRVKWNATSPQTIKEAPKSIVQIEEKETR